MLGKLLKLGTNLDWISPVAAVIQNVANDGYTFLIPVNCGRTGREIIRLLRMNGVKTWGHMIINDTITISVPESQADHAARVLDWAGVPTGAGAPEAEPGQVIGPYVQEIPLASGQSRVQQRISEQFAGKWTRFRKENGQ